MDTTSPVVWINGDTCAAASAVLPYDDHGITVGDGAFETVLVCDGRPFALTRHLDRLRRSLKALRLTPVDPTVLRDGIDAVLADQRGEGFLRITVTAGRGPLGSPRDAGEPTVIVALRPGALRREPTAVVTVPWTRNEGGALAGVKSTSYAENVVALDVAVEHGASEAMFANTRDELCEGTGSNVFVVLDGRLTTPPLSSGCLDGITRALLMEAMGDDVRAEPVPMSRLDDIEEAFLVSTGREIQPIHRWDARELGVNGPHTSAARSAWTAAYPDCQDW
jgi:branched-chain amino acid aminotransferase